MTNQHYWICEECGDHGMEPPPADGSLTCGECSGEHRLRTIAVRLMICESSEHYVPGFGTSKNRDEYLSMSALVDALVAKLRSGQVATPDVLPMPRRKTHDTTASERVAVGIYRALGNGARRRWDTNASRR